MIAEGYYRARAKEAEPGESKEGTPQIWVLFEILDEGEHKGQEISWYGYFKSTASKRIAIEGMRAAGWKGNDFNDLSSLQPSETECSLKIQHEEYAGTTRARVAFVNEAGRGHAQANPMDDDAKSRFAAMMNAELKELEGNGHPSDDGDDIPFNIVDK